MARTTTHICGFFLADKIGNTPPTISLSRRKLSSRYKTSALNPRPDDLDRARNLILEPPFSSIASDPCAHRIVFSRFDIHGDASTRPTSRR